MRHVDDVHHAENHDQAQRDEQECEHEAQRIETNGNDVGHLRLHGQIFSRQRRVEPHLLGRYLLANAAVLNEEAALRHGSGQLQVLLDEQHREALLGGDALHGAANLLHDRRLDALRRLVQQ